MHKAVKNLTDTGVNIKSGSNRGLFNFRDLTQSSMATQATVAESERDCQCRGVVTSRILQEVQSFIKFPMAEVLTCPEEKLAKCPPEILEEIFQYLDPKDLKSIVLVNKTAV